MPGVLQVRRFTDRGVAARDVIWDELLGPPDGEGTDLLTPAFRAGRRVRADEPLDAARARATASCAALPPDVRRLTEPAHYPVDLESRLAARREAMLGEDR
jgi:hypothetical protein